ncbi:MAG: cell shape-determining protein MreB [Marivirga sp.]|nr:cell shape-determining protein MreB [Marivirga sp.]
MKFNQSYIIVSVALLFLSTFISSCDDDTEIGAPPSVSVAPTTTQGLPGVEVTAEVTITAPEGLSELIILKNGASFDTEVFNGEKDATFDFSYVIEDLAIGSVVNFTFQALDAQDRYSNLATVAVTVSSKTVVDVSGVITANTTWTADKIYKLKGYVRVGDDAKRGGGTNVTGVTLTIEPGTLIVGERSSKGTLIVQRGNRIVAVGTESDPIVFTSERAPGQRQPGDWGGLVMVGRAVNNQGANIELEGGYGAYHGIGDSPIADPNADDSGELKYVRIEFAGIPINPNQEVNSLTMGSLGTGTKIDYVQTSYGLDDGFEWFGGKADAKHLIVYRGTDDDFDVDFGFSGNIQWALGIRDNALADQSGSNGFEVDNDGSGTAAEPFTSAVFSNVTIIGPKKNKDLNIQDNFQNAMHLRRNNKLKIYNSVFTGYPQGLFVDGSGTITNAAGGDLQLRNVVLAGVDAWGGNGFGSVATAKEQEVTGLPFGTNTQNPQAPRGFYFATTADIGGQVAQTWFLTTEFKNALYAKWTDLKLPEAIFDIGASSVLPATDSPLLGKTGLWDNTPAAGAFFDKNVNYIGAFGATNWTTGWTNFNPQATVYQ